MNEAAENLSAAIDCGRTDIVRAVVSALEKGEVRDLNNSLLKLEHVLNNTSLTSVGSILHYAAQAGQADIVRALLASGADPGVHNAEGKTPLDITTIERVRNVFNEELLQCVAHSNIGRACQLLAAGVSVNFQDSPTSLNTPLHWAASFGNKDSVQCLCKRGAHVNLQNIHGATALHDAVNRGDPSVVSELISHGAAVDILAETGSFANKTPLDLAKNKSSLLQVFDDNLISNKRTMDKDIANPNVSPVTTRSFEPLKLTNVASPTNGAAPSEVSMESATNSTPITVNGTSIPVPPRPLLSGPNDSRLQKLWPQPLKVIPRQGGRFQPLGVLKVYTSCNGERLGVIRRTWQIQKPSLQQIGFDLQIETLAAGLDLDVPCIVCELNPKLMPDPESYKLSVKILSSDRPGLQYAITTFIQLLKACWEEGIPPLQMHDKPSLKGRGVLLDTSKGRVPNLGSLKLFAAQLANLKINQARAEVVYMYKDIVHAFYFPLGY
ncbi:hypothetical protein CAPTEDRAFT_214107 [Capitella teleta]|uniref:Uncharacterized protein n=1 Tax=Capitella teleta TaxID=283909 RepID=R7TRK6_CAPTE|nr:hypothetical protein CAPTEDRAFT_214107 [Capitella teleta]|eukprot:ELT94131.1 hypothetical protein CAPTEDRAFT_214107 [Capitella teleta]